MMTKTEFQTLASEMGATVVFKTAAAAVFSGPRFHLTIDMNDDQLAQANPLEISSILAHALLVNGGPSGN